MPTAGSSSRSSAPSLFDLAARSLTHANAFTLSDDQQAVLGQVHQLLAESSGQRAVVVVTGSAGSGPRVPSR